MDYAYEERIGNPDLFTGRKEELAYFLKWISDVKERKSMSTALLARRKMGKTALLERLFNITFFKNDGVIPFYFEIKENDVWIVDFCQDFFLTFIYQYIAFKTRDTQYLVPEGEKDGDRYFICRTPNIPVKGGEKRGDSKKSLCKKSLKSLISQLLLTDER